jgi:hypothetical protein
MSVLPVGIGDSGDSGGYQTQRSLRLRASANPYIYRVLGAGNQRTWTAHFLWKSSINGVAQNIMQAGGVGGSLLYKGADDKIHLTLTIGSSETRVTSAVYRDVTAPLAITIAVDTTQAVAADRVKLYVNYAQVTSFSGSADPALNAQFTFNSAANHVFAQSTVQLGPGIDGNVSEFYWVDGKALTGSTFGEPDSVVTTYFKPKSPAQVRAAVAVGGGARNGFGTNGFYLPFSDPTSLTTLTYDRSQSDTDTTGNNWTATNISLTAGSTYDSMIDVPLGGGGQERGNYCTPNPLDHYAITFADGNLKVSTGTTTAAMRGTFGVSTGKWEWDVVVGAYTTDRTHMIGVCDMDVPITLADWTHANCWAYYGSNGQKYTNGSGAAYGATYTTTDVIRVKLDCDAGTLEFLKQTGGSGSFVSQGVAYSSGLTGKRLTLYFGTGFYPVEAYFNCGQRPFGQPLDTGFKALHTGNLTNTTPTSSGSFTGNLSADGPFIWCNGTPETLTINGNAVTWGTHADKLANGFKLRTASSSYNSSGTNTWTATLLSPSSKSAFKYQNAKGNP